MELGNIKTGRKDVMDTENDLSFSTSTSLMMVTLAQDKDPMGEPGENVKGMLVSC